MIKHVCATVMMVFMTCQALGQLESPATLKKGLVIRLHPGNSGDVISPNAIISAMETGSWKAPRENESVTSNGTTVGRWTAIEADSAGWIRDDSLVNSYVYYTYTSAKEGTAILDAMGNSMVYVNGSSRSGNPYRDRDTFDEWGPRFDYSLIPIALRKGLNEFLFECNRGALKVLLHPGTHGLLFAEHDATMPDLIVGTPADAYGALPIVNAAENEVANLRIKTWTDGSTPTYTPVKAIAPLSIFKAPFRITLPAQSKEENVPLHIEAIRKNASDEEALASCTIQLRVVHQGDTRKETFISDIDESVQYYAVNPPEHLVSPPALFLSLHGAGVEALNQAQAYGHKNWGYIVAPTNRRPYGYNWENWGRLDGLEVLRISKQKFGIDPSRVYLTGHSMGGHGTWQLGVHYADQFAAVGPSAGWISIWSYRIKPLVATSDVGKMLTRSTKPSDTYAFTRNLLNNGIYIIQGDADDNVPPAQAESMVANLSKFHKDYQYYVQPGAGHWWDVSDEPGADCVDWAPMFDFFAHHAVAQNDQIKLIDFTTANPGVSSKNYWIEILNQVKQQELSTIRIRLEPGKRTFTGTTGNIELLAIDASMFSADKPCTVILDSQKIANIAIPTGNKIFLFKYNDIWSLTGIPGKTQKNPSRCGSFREAFNTRPVFVYGTGGTIEENRWAFEKARYEAERIWYRGNSSIEIIKDTQFSLDTYRERSVILFGNSKTNSAWNLLLKDSPVQVDKGSIRTGTKEYRGDDYACLFLRPRLDSDHASVAVVSGTGLEGMRMVNFAQFFDQYLSFPDVVIYNRGVLQSDEKGVVCAGYFGNDWSWEKGEFILR